MSTNKLYAIIADLEHEDSPDGYEQRTIIADDTPADIALEITEDCDDIIEYVDRTTMDSIAYAVMSGMMHHAMKDGWRIDLSEPHILRWAEAVEA